MLSLLGILIGCTMIFNFFLKFDKKKTKKSIIIISIISLIFISFVSTIGNYNENKNVIDLQFFMKNFIQSLIFYVLPITSVAFLSLKEKIYNIKFLFFCSCFWVLILSLMTIFKILVIVH